MIHASGPKDRIVKADGNAGTEQRVHDNRRHARRDFADVEAYPTLVRQAHPARSRRLWRLPFSRIVPDPEIEDNAAVFHRARGLVYEHVHLVASRSRYMV
jgi:hypothetical protein